MLEELRSEHGDGMSILLAEQANGTQKSACAKVDVSIAALQQTIAQLRDQVKRVGEMSDSFQKKTRTFLQDYKGDGVALRTEDGDLRLYRTSHELLLDPKTSACSLRALCVSAKRVPELETVVGPLFRLFNTVGRDMDLVHWAMDRDIADGIKDFRLLFRTASTATRLLHIVFYSSEGKEYLKAVLGPVMRKVWKNKLPVELDPIRLPFDLAENEKADHLKKSAKMVVKATEEVLNSIFRSLDIVPLSIRKFLLYARNTFIGKKSLAEPDASKLDEEGAAKRKSTNERLAILFFIFSLNVHFPPFAPSCCC